MKYEAAAATTVSILSEADPIPPDDRAAEPRRATSSLEALYRSQAPRLLRFFARKSDRQDAGDLLQECFVRLAYSEQVRSAPPDQPEAYLTQIATNILRNRARTAFHRSIAHYEVDDALIPLPIDPIETLEARDMLNRLQAAMLRLGPKTREIFMAHRLDGATYVEIAERTGLSVKGVEWHMSKALTHIHRTLGSHL
ncbi:RNA polymerase sigma factor [Sphingomonas sp. UYP23]